MNVARNRRCVRVFPLNFGNHDQPFCSSGLQSIAMAAERIVGGYGGRHARRRTESMTMIPWRQ